MYIVWGLSDTGHVELSDHYTENQSRDWIYNYTRWGDWGGYYGLAIIAPGGDWVDTFEPFFAA